MTHDARLVLVAGALLAAGAAASLIAARLRLPALVLFLGLGMAIGTDGLGWIDFADYSRARLIGTIALVLILFEGGLAAEFREIRPVLRPSLLLAVVGTVVTAAIAGLVAWRLFDFSLEESILLGAILSPTDGAAVFALLRATRLPQRLGRTLEAEAGFNDPVAVLLVLTMINVIKGPGYGAGDVALFLLREVGIGIAVGCTIGMVAVFVFRRLGDAPPALLLVGSFASAALSYGAAAVAEGSGFLAVYLTGLALGGVHLPAKPAIRAFHEGLASVAEMGMFLALGLLVFPSQLGDVFVKGTLLALVVVLLARPVSVALATAGSELTRPERILVGWAGLRGAVPVVLATFPVIDAIPRSLEFFNIVFFAVLLSTTIQGTTIEPLARRLRIAVGSA